MFRVTFVGEIIEVAREAFVVTGAEPNAANSTFDQVQAFKGNVSVRVENLWGGVL